MKFDAFFLNFLTVIGNVWFGFMCNLILIEFRVARTYSKSRINALCTFFFRSTRHNKNWIQKEEYRQR